MISNRKGESFGVHPSGCLNAKRGFAGHGHPKGWTPNRKSESSYVVSRRRSERGALTTELLVAMALLTAALFPLAYSFASEKRMARSYYQRAVAMEIVDGEMEVLLAGEWRSFKPGAQVYHVKGSAVTNLPPGKFELEIGENKVRLQWLPSVQMQGGPVMREGKIP